MTGVGGWGRGQTTPQPPTPFIDPELIISEPLWGPDILKTVFWVKKNT